MKAFNEMPEEDAKYIRGELSWHHSDCYILRRNHFLNNKNYSFEPDEMKAFNEKPEEEQENFQRNNSPKSCKSSLPILGLTAITAGISLVSGLLGDGAPMETTDKKRQSKHNSKKSTRKTCIKPPTSHAPVKKCANESARTNKGNTPSTSTFEVTGNLQASTPKNQDRSLDDSTEEEPFDENAPQADKTKRTISGDKSKFIIRQINAGKRTDFYTNTNTLLERDHVGKDIQIIFLQEHSRNSTLFGGKIFMNNGKKTKTRAAIYIKNNMKRVGKCQLITDLTDGDHN